MKSFIQFISEAPIADDNFAQYSETPRTKSGGFAKRYSPKYFQDLFKSNFKTVGTGSSRIAFVTDVPIKMFSDSHQEILGGGEHVRTVLKLATNNKGVQQNTAEIQIWDELKYDDYAEYLCPVLDWSGNPKYSNNSQYVLDLNNYNTDINFEGDLKGAFWIQMPWAEPAHKNPKKFLHLFYEKFGPIDFDDPTMGYTADPEYALENLHCLLKPKTYRYTYDRIVREREKMLNNGTLSGEQFDALYGLIDMATAYELLDIAHYDNWGIYNNQPVIIDYGYNKSTNMIYYRKDSVDFNVYVDSSGSVRIRYKEKENEQGYNR